MSFIKHNLCLHWPLLSAGIMLSALQCHPTFGALWRYNGMLSSVTSQPRGSGFDSTAIMRIRQSQTYQCQRFAHKCTTSCRVCSKQSNLSAQTWLATQHRTQIHRFGSGSLCAGRRGRAINPEPLATLTGWFANLPTTTEGPLCQSRS